MAIGLHIGECSKEAETCPAVQEAFAADEFYETVGELDKNTPVIRAMLGKFVDTCVSGTCPGRAPEIARQILERRRTGDL